MKAAADMWEQMDADRATVARERPPGGKTLAEWTRRYKITKAVAQREVSELIAAGRLQRIGNYYLPCQKPKTKARTPK